MDSAAKDAEIARLSKIVAAYHRACGNVAAEYERFKETDPFAYHVHPDSMRRIAAAHYAYDPEAKRLLKGPLQSQ